VRTWFIRMASIPGVGFDGSPGVDRDVLPGAHDRPERSFGGSPMWPALGGSTSATPANRHVSPDVKGAELVRQTWEALELPGSARDYHCVLQYAVNTLWAARRMEPAVLEPLEVFALLDLSLVEVVPQAASFRGPSTQESFLPIASADRLVLLLEQEGALAEALGIARRLARFGQGGDAVARLSEKIAAFEAEHAGGAVR
jgi:hypothetical protein